MMRVHSSGLSDRRPVRPAVGRDLGVEAGEERENVLRQRVEHAREPAVGVDHALREHERRDEAWAPAGDEQARGRADEVADQPDGLPHHRLDERDGVVRHVVEGGRPAGVRRAALPAPVEPGGAEGGGEAVEVRVTEQRNGVP